MLSILFIVFMDLLKLVLILLNLEIKLLNLLQLDIKFINICSSLETKINEIKGKILPRFEQQIRYYSIVQIICYSLSLVSILLEEELIILLLHIYQNLNQLRCFCFCKNVL